MATSITHQTATHQTVNQQTVNQQTVNQQRGMGRTRTRSCFSVSDSAAGRGATRQESAPNRVQLEILFQGPEVSEPIVPAVSVDPAETCESLDSPKAPAVTATPRYWSGAPGAWRRVERSRAGGEATVIPTSGNRCQTVIQEDDLLEPTWRDHLWLAAGVLSLAAIFFSGV